MRRRLRKVFKKWEKKHGRKIYDDYFKIINGVYRARLIENNLEKPLLDDEVVEKDEEKSTKINPPKVKKVHAVSSMLNNHVFLDENNIQPENHLPFYRRFLIKIYGLTYLLEFVLICRFLVDIFIHCSFNIFQINYSYEFERGKYSKFYLVANILASMFMLIVMFWNFLRFVRSNTKFAIDDKEELK